VTVINCLPEQATQVRVQISDAGDPLGTQWHNIAGIVIAGRWCA